MDVFDEQTSYNLASKIVLERSCRDAGVMHGSAGGSFREQVIIENQKDTVTINEKSAKFQLVQSHKTTGTPTVRWKKDQSSPTSIYPEEVLKYVRDKVLYSPCFKDNYVSGFTCLDWKGNILRCHPSYKSGASWYDYVKVKWVGRDGTNYECPAQLLMFLDLRDSNLSDESYLANTLYAVVHSTCAERERSKPVKVADQKWKDRGKSSIVRFWTMESTYQLITVLSIDSVCFAVKDYKDQNMKEETKFILEVIPKSEWASKHKL